MVAAAIGRSFAPLTGWEQWLRCGHHGTTVDPTTEEVTLAWEAADTVPASTEGVGGWPAEAVPAEPAGLAFDASGCLYHGVPERGQLQRVPWPRPPSGAAVAEPVDLLPPVPGPPPSPGSFAPADPAAGRSIRAVALAADADEHLFVLDGDTGEIAVVDLADGHLLRRIVLRWPAVDLAADGRAILAATADRAHPLVTVDALGAPLEVALPRRALTAMAEVPPAPRESPSGRGANGGCCCGPPRRPGRCRSPTIGAPTRSR
jgi:hypothetical protein